MRAMSGMWTSLMPGEVRTAGRPESMATGVKDPLVDVRWADVDHDLGDLRKTLYHRAAQLCGGSRGVLAVGLQVEDDVAGVVAAHDPQVVEALRPCNAGHFLPQERLHLGVERVAPVDRIDVDDRPPVKPFVEGGLDRLRHIVGTRQVELRRDLDVE